jgi:hypothetical protein
VPFSLPVKASCQEAYRKFLTNMTAIHSDEPILPGETASLTGKYLNSQLGREGYGFPGLNVCKMICHPASAQRNQTDLTGLPA